MHALLLSRNQRYATPDGHQVLPFAMYRRQLAARGVRVTNTPTKSPEDRTASVRAAFARPQNEHPTVVLVMPHWSEKADALAEWFANTRAEIGDASLVMLDYYAPTCSPHFGVLPHVDRYIKRQTLRDRSLYQHPYQGGFIYADFVARHWGFDLEEWNFGSTPDPAHAHKIVTGWNLGVTPRYRAMTRLASALPLPWSARPIDIHLRVGNINRTDKAQEWYQFSRARALDAVGPLASSYRLSGSARVRTHKYFAELFLSKVVLSPFGWGEVCFRDYEAIAAGALLVKPDMSHLETYPDIYHPGETYLPVRWDLEDCAEVLTQALSDPGRSRRIIRNARNALSDYYRSGFVDHLISLLTFPRPVDRHTPAPSTD